MTDPVLEEVTLKLEALMISRMLERGIVPQHPKTSAHYAIELKAVVVEFLAYFACNTHEAVENHYHHPDGWWQALKHRLGLRCKMRATPITYRYTTICPHLPRSPPGKHLEFMTMDPKEARRTTPPIRFEPVKP